MQDEQDEANTLQVQNTLLEEVVVVVVLLYSPKRPARLEGNMPFTGLGLREFLSGGGK